MRKFLVAMCFLGSLASSAQAGLDTLKLLVNIHIEVSPSIKTKYPQVKWDSIASTLSNDANKSFLNNGYILGGPKKIFVISSPCFNSIETDSTFEVSFLSKDDEDFCSQVKVNKKTNFIENVYLDLHSNYLKHVYKRLPAWKKKVNAQTYDLHFKLKDSLATPLMNGLCNFLGEVSNIIEVKGSKERIIRIKLVKKRHFYLIKMKFSSKTSDLIFTRPSKEGDKVVKKSIKLPRKPKKEDIWKASQELNENIDFFLDINLKD